MAGAGEASNKNVLVVEDGEPLDVTQYVEPNSNITSISLEAVRKKGNKPTHSRQNRFVYIVSSRFKCGKIRQHHRKAS